MIGVVLLGSHRCSPEKSIITETIKLNLCAKEVAVNSGLSSIIFNGV